MNFAEYAHDLLNWASTHPAKAAVAAVVTVAAGWTIAKVAIAKYKAHRANRAKVDAIVESIKNIDPGIVSREGEQLIFVKGRRVIKIGAPDPKS